ncbi:hypothetical protein BYT27DRAFT_7196275 [Phlegmacium glaucopus]|nr:hypothetical protein BYT27DRAFT_7196275 [Phlegmacium glaucopus]
MTSQAAQILPFPKLTRGSFGFSLKSRKSTKTVESDEDWYIPYNGPYEAPREFRNQRKARDSWGDLVEPDAAEEHDDRQLHRYGGHNDLTDRNNGSSYLEEERKGRSRDRSFSFTSGHTVSSGTVEHSSRPNIINANRRSTVSAGTRQAVPSYISLDPMGTVGESPIPLRRSSNERNRLSLAGIFNFAPQARKPSTPTAVSTERGISGGFARKPSLLQRSIMRIGDANERVNSKIDSSPRYSSSPERSDNLPMKDKHQQLHRQVILQAGRARSGASEDDYYNSYYSTLIHEQRPEPALNSHRHRHHSPSHSENLHHSQQSSVDQSSLNHHNSSSTSSGHPYALATPRNNVEELSTAPSMPTTNPPRLTFTSPSHNPTSIESSNLTRLANLRTPKLKNSNSTPDIRSSVVLHDPVVTAGIPNTHSFSQRTATPPFVFPKAKDRWLSAETWCDALLLPRPRLKVGNVPNHGGSGRIVSPPDSPLGPAETREPGVASRVLAHSRSLVDLKRLAGLSSNYAYPRASTSVSYGQDPQTSRVGAQSRPLRPTSFAQDDLALLTPVLSLAHVLEQGQLLADEREAWKSQAKGSFGNKHARSLSRTRSKSLTQRNRRRGHQPQTSMEYLAAQACLGHQNLTPILGAADTAYTNPSRKGSHSYNSSHAQTLSKSSKSHSKNHSRGDSSSKSAAKVAKSTTAIRGFSAREDKGIEADARAASLEGALKGDGTKVIRLADPAHIPVDRGTPDDTSPNDSARLTPSSSDDADQRMGIALGTPPLDDDQTGSFYLPSHPYAQGGVSYNVAGPSSNQSHTGRGTGFAGPHRSINSGVDIPQISDSLARHKLPPHLLHPYAQGSSVRDTYLEQNVLLGQYRSDDSTPRQMKMWAQLSPGVIREVLPGDIQYSPLIPETDHISSSPSDPIHIRDTIGMGEMLVNAPPFHRRQDSNVESKDPGTHIMAAQADRDNQSHNPLPRKPVEHNRAPSGDSESPQQSSLTDQVVSASPERLITDRADSTSPAVTSTASSPQLIPHYLSSPTGLESFQDLFYRPNNHLRPTYTEAAFPDTPSPPNISTTAWDRNTQRHRTESGLTTLARQLSEEFEQMALERRRSSSQYSSKPSSRQQSSNISRRPTDGSLQFVFEEPDPSESLPELDHPAIQAFQPSGTLPEDVESSRASSLIERIETEDEDETAMLRLGVVESVLTPPSVSAQYRPNSRTGETSFTPTDAEHPQQDQPESPQTSSGISGEARARTFAGLRPPSFEEGRSSFMTTSTASRMSNLSDFPSPPKGNHMTLGTYFNEASESQSHVPSAPRPPQQQMIFGRNQDADDLAKTLSSNS